MQKEKVDITLAKGLGIFLVVLGHTLAGGTSVGNEWFSETVYRIYLFHMPFFMFISGYVFFRPGRLEGLQDQAAPFIGKQAVRMLLPFFAIGLVILGGKLVMQNLVHVDNVPGAFTDGLIKLFWATDRSPSMAIWYIFVLFVYNVMCLLLYRVLGERMHLWAALALVLYFLPAVHYLYMDRVAHYFVFFIAGAMLRHREERFLKVMDRDHLYWILPLLFALLLYVVPRSYMNDTQEINAVVKLLIGLVSIPVLFAPCRKIMVQEGWLHKGLYLLGVYSYSIYLFNTMAIGVTKGVMFKVTTWDGLHFFYFIPILILAGIIGPMIAEWLVLKRIPFVRKSILGK